MRAQKTALAALALVAGLSLTACQGNEDSAAGTDDSGSSSSSSPSNSGGDDAQQGADDNATNTGDGASATGSADANEGSGGGQINTGPCKTANLTFSTSHGMAEGDLMVAMKNTSDACSLKGFPGVDLKADNGPGGISAARSDRTAPAVVLKNGEETRFTLHTPRNDTGGSGVDIVSIVVTPPGETHSKTLPVSLNLPASDSTDSNVTVDPVGSGKQ
ncbi:DUF4232 domain-containing protein [Streptomyces endophyticus]|uniref:DUF4232 domain-containing protein n=1 Tax=Streptomyces endophyticus TaxID=714166 RepID=A0ABU6F4G5_9ACTN|nr:DUF4232 domain-containing protein [Streptomyces endophyticus]MEB8338891.1 DUF4232 domain-containing protein [Streptomyces endophyticus]